MSKTFRYNKDGVSYQDKDKKCIKPSKCFVHEQMVNKYKKSKSMSMQEEM